MSDNPEYRIMESEDRRADSSWESLNCERHFWETEENRGSRLLLFTGCVQVEARQSTNWDDIWLYPSTKQGRSLNIALNMQHWNWELNDFCGVPGNSMILY